MKEYSAILVCIPHHTNMTSAPTISTLSSTGDHWTPRRTSNYNYDELGPSDEPRKRPSRPTSRFPHIPFQKTKLCSSPSVSPRLRDPFTRTPNLDFFIFTYFYFCVCVREALERLALFHRFPLLFLPLAGVVLANSSIDIALHDTF